MTLEPDNNKEIFIVTYDEGVSHTFSTEAHALEYLAQFDNRYDYALDEFNLYRATPIPLEITEVVKTTTTRFPRIVKKED